MYNYGFNQGIMYQNVYVGMDMWIHVGMNGYRNHHMRISVWCMMYWYDFVILLCLYAVINVNKQVIPFWVISDGKKNNITDFQSVSQLSACSQKFRFCGKSTWLTGMRAHSAICGIPANNPGSRRVCAMYILVLRICVKYNVWINAMFIPELPCC